MIRLPIQLGNQRGATLVEFALVSPILLLLLLGLFDVAHTLYVKAALQGVMQKAARDSTLQDYSTASAEATLDANVISQIKAIVPGATVPTPTRRSYSTYAQASVKQAESWNDVDHDGTCDHGEPYQDANGNGAWDVDGATGGGGGAQDRTIYTVTVSYPRFFPLSGFIGLPNTIQLTATTVLQNQPYGDQITYSGPVQQLYCS